MVSELWGDGGLQVLLGLLLQTWAVKEDPTCIYIAF